MIGNIKKIGYADMLSVDFPVFKLLTDVSIDNGDDGEISSYLNREAISSERYDGSYHITHGYKWSEHFSPKVTFLKDDFSDFTDNEVRSVLSWLTSKNTPSFADFYDDVDSNAIEYSALGGWTDIQINKMGNGRVVGITAMFESVYPWALSPIHTVTKTITTPQTFTINCGTDDYESLVYPKITITQSNSIIVRANQAMTNRADHIDGTIYQYDGRYYWIDDNDVLDALSIPENATTTSVLIHNATTNTNTIIKKNIAEEIITLDGANRVVSSSRMTRIFGDDFNWHWLPLKRGDNVITVTGNCDIRLDWREPIKRGDF